MDDAALSLLYLAADLLPASTTTTSIGPPSQQHPSSSTQPATMNGLSEEDIQHASLLAEFQASGPSTPSHPNSVSRHGSYTQHPPPPPPPLHSQHHHHQHYPPPPSSYSPRQQNHSSLVTNPSTNNHNDFLYGSNGSSNRSSYVVPPPNFTTGYPSSVHGHPHQHHHGHHDPLTGYPPPPPPPNAWPVPAAETPQEELTAVKKRSRPTSTGNQSSVGGTTGGKTLSGKKNKSNNNSRSKMEDVSLDASASPHMADESITSNATGGLSASDRKRRRVVVACDTCRRKKVKCQGLPNSTNICDNCKSYGYRCTFSSEPDRSRGKYEILESKVDTLLAALRSVAPALAGKFEKGDLTIAVPSGQMAGVGREEEGNGEQETDASQDGSTMRGNKRGSLDAVAAAAAMLSSESGASIGGTGGANHSGSQRNVSFHSSSGGNTAVANSSSGPTSISTTIHNGAEASRNTDLSIARFLSDGAGGSRPSRKDLGPLLPDMEDGRPRFFGRSSTLNYFQGLDSRPPSPGPSGSGASKRLSSAHQLPWPSSASATAASVNGKEVGAVAGGVVTPALTPSRFGARTPGNATPTGLGLGVGASFATESRSRATTPERATATGATEAPAGGAGATTDSPTPAGGTKAASKMQQQQTSQSLVSAKTRAGGAVGQTLPRPRPPFPEDSKDWVALIRTKNLTAVGRDEPCIGDWLSLYSLPSEDLLLDLFDLYFTRLHPLMPILHRPTLQDDYYAGRHVEDAAFRGLVFTLLAIAARFSSDVRVRSDPDDPNTAGDAFAKASRFYHQVHAASLINVQVLLLSATFIHCDVGPGPPWTQLGVAIRALQDIGLHQDRAYHEFTEFEQELRKRAFWGAFILDCIFAVNLGRPLSLRMSDCTVGMPKDVTDEVMSDAHAHGAPLCAGSAVGGEKGNAQTVLSGWLALCELSIITHDVLLSLYTPRTGSGTGAGGSGSASGNGDSRARKAAPEYKDMATLSKRLDEWIEDTPVALRTLQNPYKWQAALVQLGTHDVRLYILKPFLFDPQWRKILEPQCIDHAKKGLQTTTELFADGHLNDMVFVLQQGFMSTSTFMITVWHRTADAERLAKDEKLIGGSLRIFAHFEPRFLSQIIKKALRLLRNIATRALPHMSADVALRTREVLETLATEYATSDAASRERHQQQQQVAAYELAQSQEKQSSRKPMPNLAVGWSPSAMIDGPIEPSESAMSWAPTGPPAAPSTQHGHLQEESTTAPVDTHFGSDPLSVALWAEANAAAGHADGMPRPIPEDASWGDYFASFLQSLVD